MFRLGFRDDLEAILGQMPEARPHAALVGDLPA